MIKKVAFIGNCQIYGLGYYFKKAFPDIEVKIILMPSVVTFPVEEDFQRRSLKLEDNIIYDSSEAIDYLYECDVVCSHNITDYACRVFNSSSIRKYLKEGCLFYIFCPFKFPPTEAFNDANSRQKFMIKCICAMRKVNLEADDLDCDGFIEPFEFLNYEKKDILQESDNEFIQDHEANFLKPIYYLDAISLLCDLLKIPFKLDVETERKKIFPYTKYHYMLNKDIFDASAETQFNEASSDNLEKKSERNLFSFFKRK